MDSSMTENLRALSGMDGVQGICVLEKGVLMENSFPISEKEVLNFCQSVMHRIPHMTVGGDRARKWAFGTRDQCLYIALEGPTAIAVLHRDKDILPILEQGIEQMLFPELYPPPDFSINILEIEDDTFEEPETLPEQEHVTTDQAPSPAPPQTGAAAIQSLESNLDPFIIRQVLGKVVPDGQAIRVLERAAKKLDIDLSSHLDPETIQVLWSEVTAKINDRKRHKFLDSEFSEALAKAQQGT